MSSLRKFIAALALVLAVSPVCGQSQPEREAMAAVLDEAQRALTAAENVGAPVYAKELYDEALARLTVARQTMGDEQRSRREQARLRALEARLAARAAEARARWVVNTSEARNLREDIARFGGDVIAMTFAEDIMDTDRGVDSRERVEYAQRWVDRAKAAGGHLVAPEDMKNAEAWLESARRIARADRQNQSADHLAYSVEMLARRAYYVALRGEVDRMLPALRLDRTRLAQAATERSASEERQRREQAERELTEMRQRLDTEAASRRAQQRELDALRAQLSEREMALRSQLDTDRLARLEAEQRLYELVARYEAALARADFTEVEAMRRQVEDQRLELQSFQERQRLSEQTLNVEAERLREELERERTSGRASAQALAEREAELSRRREELDRLRVERELSVQRATESAQHIGELERRARDAEAESQRLRAAVQESQERAQAAQQQAQQLQSELERVRSERDQLERMQQLVGTGAQVRADTRGMIVTLPGIYFDSGQATLKPGARNILSKISDELKRTSGARVSIEGHTDSVGSEAMNQQLSQRRAEAVRDFLVGQGLDSATITVSGRGEVAPMATNDTAAGRQQNRRVEIIISQ
jgi:outer membrane protein OmpA-like peptidoglycan-associated protein